MLNNTGLKKGAIINYIIISLFCVSLNSCANYEKKGHEVEVDIENTSDVNYSRFFENIDFIQLEVPIDEIFGNTGKVFFTKGYIGLLDNSRNSVWIFTESGDYVSRIDIVIGEGPGEVKMLSDATFGNEGEVHVLGVFSIKTFDYNGQLLEEIETPFLARNFEFLSNENAFITFMNNEYTTLQGERDNNFYNLILYDRKGNLIKKYLPISQQKKNLSLLLLSNFYTYKGTLHHYSFLDKNIYKINGLDNLSVKYNIDYQENEIPESIYRERENFETGMSFLEENIFSSDYPYLNSVMETENYLIIGVSYNEKRGILFFNKINKKSEFVTRGKFHNDFIPGMDIYFHLNYEHAVYGIKSAAEILNFIDNLEEKTEVTNELYKRISKNDGPVLIKAKVK